MKRTRADMDNSSLDRCDHNTTGSQCERCAVGFYGDATQGTPQDCQPCPCPLTIASNQFSRICKIESDGKPTCTACQTGYSGRTCNRCAKGYAGDPTKPGQKCVKLPAGFMPTVKIRPMKRIKTEGEDATFYCFAGGKGLPRTTWSRQNGKPLSGRAVVSGKILLMRRVRKEDEGTYECTARNGYGFDTATSQLIVKALRVDPITVSVSPKVLRVPLNQTAQFKCKAKSITDYQLKWTRGMYGALPEGAENDNGVLTIKYTRSIHGGTYTCTGKNAFNEDMVTVQLRVGVTRPQVFVSPASLSVREGDSAQFRCSASGFPAPVLQWHGGPGGRLPPEAQSSNGNGLLTFAAVKKKHEGEYFCTASNLGGISSTGTFLNVSAPGSVPVISVTPITLTVLEGEQALFECTAEGDPTPTIRWSRENGRLPQFSSSENGLLIISSTNLEDGGAYVCTAANAIGADGFLVTLTVKRDTSVPPTAAISTANQTVDEGASVFLTCQVSGDPYPSIEWKKVGDELTDNHVIVDGLLQIQEVTKEDEGMYVCIAQNKKGVEQATSIINVRSQVMPKIEIMPAKKLTVTGGDTVVFRCVVKAGNPPPSVVWETEENKPLNSSNNGVLVISPASGDSQGKYICKATNVMGSTEAVALLIVQVFMFTRYWWYWHSCALKFSLFVLFIVVAIGEFGCFWWAFCSWRIPKTSRDSLNLLFVSDSQIQGYRGEHPGILGSIARLDSDWYLTKAFFFALSSFSADVVIHLGDLLDEGYIATDDEFQEYKVRHDKIFNTPDGISRIHVAGDNDIGGESSDVITEKTVSRFSKNFGPINDVLRLKSFQIVKINSLSFLRRRPLRDEQISYNDTISFIEELPLKLHKDKISILIGHVPLGYTNKKHFVPIMKLIDAVRPRYAFSGHTHKSASFEYKIGSVLYTEYVVPTCSYRMGTDKIGAAVAVIGVDGSIDYSLLPLPTRYSFLYAYLLVLCVCVTLALLPSFLRLILFIVRPVLRRVFHRRRIGFISVGRTATSCQYC